MRIHYVTQSRIPGTAANAIQVMKMAEALAMAGHDVTLCGVGNEKVAAGCDLASLYGVSRLPALVLREAPDRLAPHLQAVRAAGRARMAGAELVLTRSIAAAAACSLLGVPTIFECHAPPQRMELLYWHLMHRAPGFRRIVVISQALARILAERHTEAARCDLVVAHDGVDVARFAGLPPPDQAKTSRGLDPARPLAGYAGHLYAGRGIDLILECARRKPEWDFLLAGGTESDVAHWRQAAAELPNVTFVGFVPNRDLPGLLAACDVVLMPYQRQVRVSGRPFNTAEWMSPLKMFEYLAMGRAIIASDLPVLREVLDETVAVLVAPDGVDEWVAALDRLGDPAGRSRLAKAAAALAPHYDWTVRTKKMLANING